MIRRRRSSTRVKTVSSNDESQKKTKKAKKGKKGDQNDKSNQEMAQRKQDDHVLLNGHENDGVTSPKTADKAENI